MRVTRDVTQQECWWLSQPVSKGDIVYRCYLHTYGVVGPGVAVTLVPNEYPFFELPWNSVEEVEE